MKKLIIATISILFISCGGSNWSCKKRYCDTNKKQPKIEFTKKVKITPSAAIACK